MLPLSATGSGHHSPLIPSNRLSGLLLISSPYQGDAMIDFRTIETFLWVANLRSFRGAAEKLNTTQPAVSMRIAQLEDLLGVRRLERDRRVVAPTPKGQEMVGYA